VRLAFGSVAPTVVRATTAENRLRGADLAPDRIDAALAALPVDLTPIDDVRSTASYRARVARNLVREFLESCAAR
jgi:xanthine dehydrogenase small subunit